MANLISWFTSVSTVRKEALPQVNLSSVILEGKTTYSGVPQVNLSSVILEGKTTYSGEWEVSVDAFLGIKYATAQRFEAPISYSYPEHSTNDVSSTGDICPQNFRPSLVDAGIKPQNQSEDCLHVNVWRPKVDEPKMMPVHVFIHGGAFEMGSSSVAQYDGQNLIAKNAAEGEFFILVSFNYRVGILGSFYNSKGQSGNYGILDQKAALTWVHNNIEKFGGDKNNVTIFGESAGGMSIGIQLLDGTQNGLYYQRAIMQSNPYGIKYKDAESAEWLANKVMKQEQNIKTVNFSRVLEVQQKMKSSINDQVENLRNILPKTAGFLPWAPYVDAITVPFQPYDIQRITGNNVDVEVGFNDDESNIFIAPFEVLLDVPGSYIMLTNMFFGKEVGSALRKLDEFNLKPPTLPAKRKEVTRQLLNMVLFQCSSHKVAKTLSLHAPQNLSLYKFEYQPDFTVWPEYYIPSMAKSCPPHTSCCHAAELSFIFGVEVNAVSGNVTFSQQDRKTADILMSNWLKRATFSLYNNADDNINVFTDQAEFVTKQNWDANTNQGLCEKVTAIMQAEMFFQNDK